MKEAHVQKQKASEQVTNSVVALHLGITPPRSRPRPHGPPLTPHSTASTSTVPLISVYSITTGPDDEGADVDGEFDEGGLAPVPGTPFQASIIPWTASCWPWRAAFCACSALTNASFVVSRRWRPVSAAA
jgi:hypothetical protein